MKNLSNRSYFHFQRITNSKNPKKNGWIQRRKFLIEQILENPPKKKSKQNIEKNLKNSRLRRSNVDDFLEFHQLINGTEMMKENLKRIAKESHRGWQQRCQNTGEWEETSVTVARRCCTQ